MMLEETVRLELRGSTEHVNVNGIRACDDTRPPAQDGG